MTNEEFIKELIDAEYIMPESVVPHAKNLVNLADQVDAMLSIAKRKYQTVVDDGDYWEISDDTFQEVQKAFDEIKTALPKEP